MIEEINIARELTSQLEQISSKTYIKNAHSIIQILYYEGKIVLISKSSIQIHSIKNIINQLPSLIDIIDIQSILKQDQPQNNGITKDELTYRITQNQKKALGTQIFGENLSFQNNIFMENNLFKGRLQYLNGEKVQIQNAEISKLGDFFIKVNGGRALYLNRQILKQGSLKLKANLQQYIVKLHQQFGDIVSGVFAQNLSLTLSVINRQSMKGNRQHHNTQKMMKLINIVFSQEGKIQKKRNIGHKKSLQIPSKGFLSIFHLKHIPAIDHEQSLLVLFYIDKVSLIAVNDSLSNSFSVSQFETINFKQKVQKQYINSVWYCPFMYYNWIQDFIGEQSIFYLTNAAGIWKLKVDWPQSFNVSLKKIQKSNSPLKSHIYLVLDQIRFFENINNESCIATNTSNNLIIKLYKTTNLPNTVTKNVRNYKDGYLYIMTPPRSYIIAKMLQNVLYSQKRSIGLTYTDLQESLCMNPESDSSPIHNLIRKQILEQLTRINKQVKESIKSKSGELYMRQDLLNIIIYNCLVIFESKPIVAEKIKNQIIKKWFENNTNSQLHNDQKTNNYNSDFFNTKCYFSNRKIMTEDVMYCQKCNMFAIKQVAQKYSKICYICKNIMNDL